MHRWGLAPSALQFEVRRRSGGLVGRTDFAWEDRGVLGEFDGRVKYGRLLRPGQDPGDAVFEEKRREDAIRDEGWGVVRWVWSDLNVPHRLRHRRPAGTRERRSAVAGDQLLECCSRSRSPAELQDREQHLQ